MKKSSQHRLPLERKPSSNWPETFRWLATGALVAYSAVGMLVVAYTQPPAAGQTQTAAADNATYSFNLIQHSRRTPGRCRGRFRVGRGHRDRTGALRSGGRPVSGNVWTTYQFPFGLMLGGGLRFLSNSYLGRPDNAERIIPNGNAGKLPGYTVLDFMASHRVNRYLTLRFNVDNVTDAFYPISTNWAGGRVFLGPTRNFRISSDITF